MNDPEEKINPACTVISMVKYDKRFILFSCIDVHSPPCTKADKKRFEIEEQASGNIIIFDLVRM